MKLNPAFAGLSYGPRFVFNYKNQWPALHNAFVNYAVSYDQHFDKLNGGIGIIIQSDQLGNGIYSEVQMSGIYSYQIELSKTFIIKSALEGTYTQKRLSWDKVILPDMINKIDLRQPKPTGEKMEFGSSVSYFDAAAGILFYTPKLFGGIAVKHLAFPKNTFYSGGIVVPLRINTHISTVIPLSRRDKDKYYISPTILQVHQGTFNSLQVGGILNRSAFFGGLYFKHAFENVESIMFQAGVSKGVLRFGYSFEVTVGGFGYSGGIHEFSLILNFAEQGASSLNSGSRSPMPSPVFF